MIVLSAINDLLQAILGAAHTTNPLRCVCIWRDITAAAYTPGRTVINTNGAADVDISGSPAAATQRVIDYISIYNSDTVTHTLTIKYDAAGTDYEIWKGTLQAGEKIEYVDGTGWKKLGVDGAPLQSYSASPSDIQSWTTFGAKTWIKPTSFTPKSVTVILYGAGGGGGGGSSQTGAVVRTGGSGGGGGARSERTFLVSDLAANEPITVGTGGTVGGGGAAGADGTDGGAGGNTTFSSGQKLLTAFGGGGGYRGRASAQTGAGGAGGGLNAAGGTGTTAAATGGAPGPGATPVGGGGIC